MSTLLLSASDGIVKINNDALDAIVTGISITGEVIFDEQKKDNLSGTRKVPQGWTDADVTISIDLITDAGSTCYDRLAKVNAIFKTRTNAPQVFEIVNKHLSARGIRKVVFSKFDSSETNADDVIAVTMSFTEYEPAVVQAEKGESSGGAAPSGSATEPKPDAVINADLR